MVQAHTLHQGLDVVRPTQDIDVIVHVETPLGRSAQAADALETLGYRLQEPVDPRGRTAHRSAYGRRDWAPMRPVIVRLVAIVKLWPPRQRVGGWNA